MMRRSLARILDAGSMAADNGLVVAAVLVEADMIGRTTCGTCLVAGCAYG